MSSSPLVTVIVVNFNFEAYVRATLESVKDLAYDNMELIVIDDCSRDQSVDLIRQWLSTCRIPSRLVLNERNLGVCATLNKAFAMANGKYISATAGDDILMPEKLLHQVPLLEAAGPDVCAVYSDAYLIREDGSAREKNFIATRNVQGIPQGNIFPFLLTDNFIPAMSVLLRTDCFHAVGGFDEKLVYEDYDLWLRMAKQYRFLYSGYISVKYRIKEKSLSTSIEWDIPNTRVLLKHIHDHPMVLEKLQEIALKAYRKGSEKVMGILSAGSVEDRYIRRLLWLHRYKVPAGIGQRLLPTRSGS
jgi:glycosyltransferase involved in cell wall biosynthesis